MQRRILFLLRHPPGSHVREALDSALVAGVFDQQVTLLFRDEGVLQLNDGPEGVTDLLRTLPDYDIRSLYVCAACVERHGLDPATFAVPVTPLSASEQHDLLSQQDMVIPD